MIRDEHLLMLIQSPCVSEKTSNVLKKTNTIVIKVNKKSTKSEIKFAIQRIFKVKVKFINTLIIKGKIKRHGKYIGHRSDWKKAYIFLEKGHNLDLIHMNK